jgi:hypothetical protein
MEKIELFNRQLFRVTLVTPGVSQDIYKVERLSGEWPDDLELINLCDKFNLGGIVEKRDDQAFVIVYTD